MLTDSGEGALLLVRVVPGAKKNQVAGVSGGRLRVRVQAPPVEGRANRELVEYLAGALGLRKKEVIIRRGESSREKTLLLTGMSSRQALLKLRTLLPEE